VRLVFAAFAAERGSLPNEVALLRGEPAEEPEYASEPDCADCPDYDDCANPWICIATVDDC
jgi:hypothetical protein